MPQTPTTQSKTKIPEGWEEVKLRDVVKVNQGLQIPISERFTEKNLNRKIYITIQYLNNKSVAEYIENFSDSVVCKPEDILMTRTGNTGIVVTGVSGVFHNNFFKVKPNIGILKPRFLTYFLRSPLTQ